MSLEYPATGNGTDPLSLEELLRSSGPHALGGEPTSDDELFERLDRFGRDFWRVGRVTEREVGRQIWTDYFRQQSIPAVKDAWRVVDAAIRAGKNGVPETGGTEPRLIADLLADPNLGKAPEWVLAGYAAKGEVMLLAGQAKTGKSTFCADMACHVAGGIGYIGQRVQAAPVLWLNMEQHPRRVVALFKDLQADGLPIHVSSESPIRFDLEAYIKEHGIGLVITDSLSRYWAVEDENDSVQVTRAIRDIRNLALETDAAVVLIDHTRKSGGEDGNDVRGSGAKTASVDVAVSFKRDRGQDNRRVLDAISRSGETPRKLVVEYEAGGYRAVGLQADVHQEEQRAAVLEALGAGELDASEIAEAADINQRAARRIAHQLYEDGTIGRGGTGKRGDPFRFAGKAVRLDP